MKANTVIMLWIIAPILAVFVLIGGCIMWEWYVSGRQAAIWQEQGVGITQWDVFIGITPATQVKPTRIEKK